jgi:hypothetical protein
VDLDRFGPFANVVVLGTALVATFSLLITRLIGGIKRWTWLAGNAPSHLVSAGPRVLAVALMAATYVTIDRSNYRWFGLAAVVSGLLGFLTVIRFDRLRRHHVVVIPLVGPTGAQLRDKRGEPLVENVVIGSERDLRPEAAAALATARQRFGGVSLRQFMSGYGAQSLNDPEALWDRELLATLAARLTTSLMYVVLFAGMTGFLAALVIDVAIKDAAP